MSQTGSYQVIARRWRPQQFADLVGQDGIVRTLTNAINNQRIAHAYLLVGPRGTGKTTTARLLAMALNAEGGPNASFDPDSETSRAIAAGRFLDVIEIDGASNNSVDQVRELRDSCQYAPAEGSFKIYIIDEVHMLSQAAFNALLKTLEEPPAHVKFIFATTDSHKVLPTIVSRCQRLEFHPIPDETVVAKLKSIIDAEGIQVEDAVLQLIARQAQGGMRDAQSILDQLIAFCGNDLKASDVLSVYGLSSEEHLQRFLKAIMGNDAATLLTLTDELVQDGKDLFRVILDLQDQVHTAIVHHAKHSPIAWAEELSIEALRAILSAFQDGLQSIQRSSSPRVPFELALLQAAEECRSKPINELLSHLADIAKSAAASSVASTSVVESTSAPERVAHNVPDAVRSFVEGELRGQVEEVSRIS